MCVYVYMCICVYVYMCVYMCVRKRGRPSSWRAGFSEEKMISRDPAPIWGHRGMTSANDPSMESARLKSTNLEGRAEKKEKHFKTMSSHESESLASELSDSRQKSADSKYLQLYEMSSEHTVKISVGGVSQGNPRQ